MPASKAAGMYSVESIKSLITQSGTFEITSDVRLMTGNTQHYVSDLASSAFTAYQSTTIQFKVPYNNLKEGATTQALGFILNGTTGNPNPWLPNEYVETSSIVPYPTTTYGPCNVFLNKALGPFFYFYVEYLKMPNIIEVQSYVDSAAERSLSADMLVKAPVPIMCSLQMRLMKPSGAEDPDMEALKAALVSKFNSFEMGQGIPASALIHTAYQNIPSGYTIDLPVHMYGVVINPDMSKDVLYSSDALRAPKLYSKGVTGNTCAFFLESNLIDITVVECA